MNTGARGHCRAGPIAPAGQNEGIYLLHNTDTIGPSPKVSDNTALCNAGDMPADGVNKAADIYLIDILLRNIYCLYPLLAPVV
ncbi:MAG: hypothetical protein PHX56_08535 [Atribacterota bacterium]|nr:hypothetical protein [Atribacterota bacterium]